MKSCLEISFVSENVTSKNVTLVKNKSEAFSRLNANN